jgi:hypothetical protein
MWRKELKVAITIISLRWTKYPIQMCCNYKKYLPAKKVLGGRRSVAAAERHKTKKTALFKAASCIISFP